MFIVEIAKQMLGDSVITRSVMLLNVDTQCTSIVSNLLGEDRDSEKACADHCVR